MRTYSFLIVAALAAVAAPAAAQPSAPEVKQDPSQKMVCKKISETGSLVRRTKVCLTREQWERSAENHRKYGEDLQDNLRGKPGGGN